MAYYNYQYYHENKNGMQYFKNTAIIIYSLNTSILRAVTKLTYIVPYSLYEACSYIHSYKQPALEPAPYPDEKCFNIIIRTIISG